MTHQFNFQIAINPKDNISSNIIIIFQKYFTKSVSIQVMDFGLQFALIIPLVGMPHIITHRIEYLKTANTQLVKQYKIGSVDNHQAISI